MITRKCNKVREDDDFAEEIAYLEKRYPEVSFAKLSRIAAHAALWQKNVTINKACRWLFENYREFPVWVDEFYKAMQEE